MTLVALPTFPVTFGKSLCALRVEQLTTFVGGGTYSGDSTFDVSLYSGGPTTYGTFVCGDDFGEADTIDLTFTLKKNLVPTLIAWVGRDGASTIVTSGSLALDSATTTGTVNLALVSPLFPGDDTTYTVTILTPNL